MHAALLGFSGKFAVDMHLLLFRDDIAMWADTVYEIVETWQYGAVPLVLAAR